MSQTILDALAEVAEARGRMEWEKRKAEKRRWRLICGELYSIHSEGMGDRLRDSAARMSRSKWINMLMRAVENSDNNVLASIAEQLSKVEVAAVILRAKGYGGHGQSIDIAVRDVPVKDR